MFISCQGNYDDTRVLICLIVAKRYEHVRFELKKDEVEKMIETFSTNEEYVYDDGTMKISHVDKTITFIDSEGVIVIMPNEYASFVDEVKSVQLADIQAESDSGSEFDF